MARIHHIKSAQQRYRMVPKLNDDGTPVITAVVRKNGEPKTTKRGREVTRHATIEDRTQPLPMPKCGKCGITIEVGQPYKWVAVKSGPYSGDKLIRCAACPTWRQSELTSSKMAGVYAAQEQLDDEIGLGGEVDLEGLRDDLADQIESVADEYEESATNMVDGFGHETAISDEIQQKADDLRAWADDIRNVDFDEFDETAFECADDETAEEHEQRLEYERDAWLSEQCDRLSDEMGNCPV